MIYNPPLKSEILQAQNSEPVRPVRFAALCMLIAPGTKLKLYWYCMLKSRMQGENVYIYIYSWKENVQYWCRYFPSGVHNPLTGVRVRELTSTCAAPRHGGNPADTTSWHGFDIHATSSFKQIGVDSSHSPPPPQKKNNTCIHVTLQSETGAIRSEEREEIEHFWASHHEFVVPVVDFGNVRLWEGRPREN